MSSMRKRLFLRRLLRAPVYLYRWRMGWLLGKRFMLLSHIGRRSGLPRHTVLEVMEYSHEGPEMVVMSGFGRNSDWLRNIESSPDVRVIVGARSFAASHRFLSDGEAVDVVKNYERKNHLAILLLRFVLSRLLGWRYRGSAEDRERLVKQLPLIAFRPRS